LKAALRLALKEDFHAKRSTLDAKPFQVARQRHE
jgi:hypothetical protein